MELWGPNTKTPRFCSSLISKGESLVFCSKNLKTHKNKNYVHMCCKKKKKKLGPQSSNNKSKNTCNEGPSQMTLICVLCFLGFGFCGFQVLCGLKIWSPTPYYPNPWHHHSSILFFLSFFLHQIHHQTIEFHSYKCCCQHLLIKDFTRERERERKSMYRKFLGERERESMYSKFLSLCHQQQPSPHLPILFQVSHKSFF